MARAASVSVGTVSKALNNNGSLRQETRERVIAAAKALGFRPNDATDDSEREAQHVESPALVTGANKGIGHEVARQLGSMGFHVLVGARNSENGQRTTEALRKTGATATFISLDVSDPESIGEAVHLFWGELGVSVHNRTFIHLRSLASRSMNRSIAFGTFLLTLCHGRVRTYAPRSPPLPYTAPVPSILRRP